MKTLGVIFQLIEITHVKGEQNRKNSVGHVFQMSTRAGSWNPSPKCNLVWKQQIHVTWQLKETESPKILTHCLTQKYFMFPLKIVNAPKALQSFLYDILFLYFTFFFLKIKHIYEQDYFPKADRTVMKL